MGNLFLNKIGTLKKMDESPTNNVTLNFDGNVTPDINFRSSIDVRNNNNLELNYKTQARNNDQPFHTNQPSILVDDTMDLAIHSEPNENIDVNVLPSNFE